MTDTSTDGRKQYVLSSNPENWTPDMVDGLEAVLKAAEEMNRSNTMKQTMPPKDYQTFEQLADYARQRAKISADRRGHQEFAYWITIMSWARDCADDVLLTPEEEFRFYVEQLMDADGNPVAQAEAYAFTVHLRQMLINRGERPPRLSLTWLRMAASVL